LDHFLLFMPLGFLSSGLTIAYSSLQLKRGAFQINDPNYNLQMNGKAQPDYIFFDEISGEKYIVECKGTQTSRAESVHQLRRGMEQVWTIQPTDSKPLTRLIIATCLLKHKTVAYILDPPSDESEKGSLDDDFNYSKNTERIWEPESDAFRRNVRLVARAKMLAYAGLDEDAQKLAPESIQNKNQSPRRPIGIFKSIKTDLGEFDGTSISIRYRDGTEIELFKGISSQSREYFLQSTINKDKSLSEETDISGFYKNNYSAFEKNNNWTKTDGDQNNLIVQSICRDGTILQITIKGNGSI